MYRYLFIAALSMAGGYLWGTADGLADRLSLTFQPELTE